MLSCVVKPLPTVHRHYMCFLYLGKRMMEELNFFRDPHFGVPLEALWSDEQVPYLHDLHTTAVSPETQQLTLSRARLCGG